MWVYRIYFTREAQKALLHLPKITANLLRQKIEQLAQDPYAPNLNVLKLQGRSGYRLRVGDWRIIYEVKNDELIILVVKIAQRGDVYR